MSGRWSDPSERSGAVQIWGKVRDKQELIENLELLIADLRDDSRSAEQRLDATADNAPLSMEIIGEPT